MRKFFIVLGNDVDDTFLTGIINLVRIFDGKDFILDFRQSKETAHTILEKTLERIRTTENFQEKMFGRPKGETDNYRNTLVVYCGENTELFSTNLPCDTVNLLVLKQKLIEVVGGFDTPQQKELVWWMLDGALEGLRDSESISKIEEGLH